MQVKRLTARTDADCDVLFVSSTEGAQLESILRDVPPRLLTVSEVDTRARVASAINFVVEDDRVAFDVNLAVATRAQLGVSSRLLSAARAVDGRKRRGD
jgi:hypothetical protein